MKKIESHLPSTCHRLTGQKVCCITNFDSRYLVVQTSMGKFLKAKVVIMGLPWQAVKEIEFNPPLWPTVIERARQYEAFAVLFVVEYKHSTWNLVENGSGGSHVDCQNRLYCYEVAPQTIAGALYCNGSADLPLDTKNHILELLVKKFGFDMLFAKQFRHAVLPQAILINFPETDTHDLLIWASSNSATSFRGFLNGAVHAGLHASMLALNIVRPSLITLNDLRTLGFTTKSRPPSNTSCVERYLLSMNICSAVRAAKLLGSGLLGYLLYRRCCFYFSPK